MITTPRLKSESQTCFRNKKSLSLTKNKSYKKEIGSKEIFNSKFYMNPKLRKRKAIGNSLNPLNKTPLSMSKITVKIMNKSKVPAFKLPSLDKEKLIKS